MYGINEAIRFLGKAAILIKCVMLLIDYNKVISRTKNESLIDTVSPDSGIKIKVMICFYLAVNIYMKARKDRNINAK